MASILALMPSAHAGAIIIDHNSTIPANSTSDISMCGDVDGTGVVGAHLLLAHVLIRMCIHWRADTVKNYSY
jgi:hypothetical protein